MRNLFLFTGCCRATIRRVSGWGVPNVGHPNDTFPLFSHLVLVRSAFLREKWYG